MASKVEALVVGAGLAGLNAAIALQEAGIEVIVLEASDRPGGRVTSDLIDGFICDRGFQLINSKYPALQELNVISEIDFLPAPRVIEVALGDDRRALGTLSSPMDCTRPSNWNNSRKVSVTTFLNEPPKKRSIG